MQAETAVAPRPRRARHQVFPCEQRQNSPQRHYPDPCRNENRRRRGNFQPAQKAIEWYSAQAGEEVEVQPMVYRNTENTKYRSIIRHYSRTRLHGIRRYSREAAHREFARGIMRTLPLSG